VRYAAGCDELLQKTFVGGAAGKITRPSCSQGLIDGLFETMMRLFHIAVFMGHARIVPAWLHAVMLHERLVANGSVVSILFA
jgi:hypothetical protein